MSLHSRFNQLKSRVGEFKDKFAERQKRHDILDEDDQTLESQVMGIREGFNVLLKKQHDFFPLDEKRISLHLLGTKMMQTGATIGDTSPFGAFYTKVGRLQLDLGQLEIMRNREVQQHVHEPVRAAIQQEYPKLIQLRKRLQSHFSEYDAVSNRLAQATAKLNKHNSSGEASRVDTIKTDFEQAESSFQSCKSQYIEELINLMSKDEQFISPLMMIVEEQLAYHERSIEILRAALPSLKDMRAAVGNRKVFGNPLPSSGVDPLLAQLAAVINRDGLGVVGIFRIAGSAVRIRQLKAAISSGRADFRVHVNERDIHAVANALKLYLREIPDGLLTTHLYAEWVAAARLNDHSDRLYAIKNLSEKLPQGNFCTLRFLARFLFNVSLHAEETKMEVSNLGIVIGPNLGWPADYELNVMYAATDSGPLGSLCEALITYNEWIFPSESGELPGTILDPYCVPNAYPPPPTASVDVMEASDAFNTENAPACFDDVETQPASHSSQLSMSSLDLVLEGHTSDTASKMTNQGLDNNSKSKPPPLPPKPAGKP